MIDRPPQAAIEQLAKAVRRAKRTSVRLPQGFARDLYNPDANTPLALLIRGNGAVRLKTFLTVLMMATKAPHDTQVASKHIAEMLNLSEPDEGGARRVSKAFKDLEKMNLVRRTTEPGHTPKTSILKPDGSGADEWSDNALDRPYITLPADLWRRGWIAALSGRAVAMLIILREFTNGRQDGAYVDGIRKRQYALSDDFWTKATTELVDAGLLSVEQEVLSYRREPRRRNRYHLHVDRLRGFDPGAVPLSPGEIG